MPYLAAAAMILPTSGGPSGTGGVDLSTASSPTSSKKRSSRPPGVRGTSNLPGLGPTFSFAERHRARTNRERYRLTRPSSARAGPLRPRRCFPSCRCLIESASTVLDHDRETPVGQLSGDVVGFDCQATARAAVNLRFYVREFGVEAIETRKSGFCRVGVYTSQARRRLQLLLYQPLLYLVQVGYPPCRAAVQHARRWGVARKLAERKSDGSLSQQQFCGKEGVHKADGHARDFDRRAARVSYFDLQGAVFGFGREPSPYAHGQPWCSAERERDVYGRHAPGQYVVHNAPVLLALWVCCELLYAVLLFT